MKTKEERIYELKILYFINNKTINKYLVSELLTTDDNLYRGIIAIENFVKSNLLDKEKREEFIKYFDKTRPDYTCISNRIYNTLFEKLDKSDYDNFEKINNGLSIDDIKDNCAFTCGDYNPDSLNSLYAVSYIGMCTSIVVGINGIIYCNFDDEVTYAINDYGECENAEVRLDFIEYAVVAEFEENDMILFPEYTEKYGKFILKYHPELSKDIRDAIIVLEELNSD